jgi:hypothetical protein
VFLNIYNLEALAKPLKAREKGHSGQAMRDPESRIFKQFWIPAFAGMTAQVTLARTSFGLRFPSEGGLFAKP